jgi:hypothetical protein
LLFKDPKGQKEGNMKLGTDTGSLVNYMYGNSASAEPTIGMGATILCWSDRHACTVISYDPKAKIVEVQRDNAKRVDGRGMSDSQDWEYTADPKGAVSTFKKDKTGRWHEIVKNAETGRWNKTKGARVSIGHRDEHYDYSF